MKDTKTGGLVLLAVIILSIPLSLWCIYGEGWRHFQEKERRAYETSARAFRNSLGPVAGLMVGDLNRAIKEPPLEPCTEHRGRQWVLHLNGPQGKVRKVLWYLKTGERAGMCREAEGEKPPLIIPLALKSVEFRKIGDAAWQCAFTWEVHTAYGYMGDDWLLYSFGRPK